MRKDRRLPAGGLINRALTARFVFDGTTFDGYHGDTLASALIANGVGLVGRSFKYHRPRGIFSAGPEEPNALVELRTGARREPNCKATTVELFDGLEALSQNRWPSLKFDFHAINQIASPLLVAGFYYKTFMWPTSFWEKLYEPAIRRAAGLGSLSGEPDPDSYETAYAFCDLLVIGAGPAGLSAALCAARAGARVILAEEDFLLGGRVLSETHEIDGVDAASWVRGVESELRSLSNARILIRTSVFGAYDGEYGALERVSDHLLHPAPGMPRQRLWKIVAGEALLCTGAIERPIAFGGNDRPGVMQASAVRTYLNRYAAIPGHQLLVFTSCDDGWRTAADARRAGVTVQAVVDTRPEVAASVRAPLAGVRMHLGSQVTGTLGGHRLRSVEITNTDGRRLSVKADTLAVSGGWNPNIGIATHLGGRATWSDDHAGFVCNETPGGMHLAGAVAGRWTLADALEDGARAGADAARRVGRVGTPYPHYRTSEESSAVSAFWHVSGGRGKSFVDFQNDVTVNDIAIAEREGFRSVEHLKRYTTLGMATDQGKTSNAVGIAIMAALSGKSIAEVGTTRSRPPHVPVAIGAFAGIHTGRNFRPTRLTPSHGWATSQGATFVEAGQWLRAQWFSRPGEADWLTSVTREATSVRQSVGICDVSTLGKIALTGSDVGAFLDRVYINMFSTLPVGKVRYGVMLREDGFVMDDGTTARLDDHHYVLTTTTANAGRVMQHLEFCHQVLWPELDVQMVSVTEQWAQYAVAGPRSRELLQALLGDAIDLSNEAFPYLACVERFVQDIPVRIFRVSFSGELAFEIAVPSGRGNALMRTLMEAGKAFDAIPYGTEALSVLRIEKGHVSGAELNGQTVARDLGLGRMMSTKKDFIGRIMASRPALVDPQRPTLVGLEAVDPAHRFRNGALLIPRDARPSPDTDHGYVTSTAFSPAKGYWMGLGLLRNGPERIGECVRAYDPVRSSDIEVKIVSPLFVDPEGQRLHA